MLKGSFYSIVSLNLCDHSLQVTLNRDHIIYKGHFPSHPITPGVCSLQMICECAAELFHENLILSSISLCRFKGLISPFLTHELTIVFDDFVLRDEKYFCAVHVVDDKNNTLLTLRCLFDIVPSFI